MTMRNFAAATALAVLAAATPLAAHAAPVAGSRAPAAVGEGESLGGGHGLAWAMAGLIAVITAVLIFEDRGEETTPASP